MRFQQKSTSKQEVNAYHKKATAENFVKQNVSWFSQLEREREREREGGRGGGGGGCKKRPSADNINSSHFFSLLLVFLIVVN